MSHKIFGIVLFLVFIGACSDSSVDEALQVKYLEGCSLLREDKVDDAYRVFESIITDHPTSSWAMKANEKLDEIVIQRKTALQKKRQQVEELAEEKLVEVELAEEKKQQIAEQQNKLKEQQKQQEKEQLDRLARLRQKREELLRLKNTPTPQELNDDHKKIVASLEKDFEDLVKQETPVDEKVIREIAKDLENDANVRNYSSIVTGKSALKSKTYISPAFIPLLIKNLFERSNDYYAVSRYINLMIFFVKGSKVQPKTVYRSRKGLQYAEDVYHRWWSAQKNDIIKVVRERQKMIKEALKQLDEDALRLMKQERSLITSQFDDVGGIHEDYSKTVHIIRRFRAKFAIPYLIKSLYVHCDNSGLSQQIYKTLMVLCGEKWNIVKTSQNPYYDLFIDLSQQWWPKNQQAISTKLEDMNTMQLRNVIAGLLHPSYYSSYQRTMDVYTLHALVAGRQYAYQRNSNDPLSENMLPVLLEMTLESEYQWQIMPILSQLCRQGYMKTVSEFARDQKRPTLTRIICILALQKAGQDIMIPELLKILSDEKDILTRTIATLSLEHGNHEQVMPVLRSLLQDSNREVRTAACLAMKKFRINEAVDDIAKMAYRTQQSPQECRAIFDLLGSLQTEKVQDILIHMIYRYMNDRNVISYGLTAFEKSTGQRFIPSKDSLQINPRFGVSGREVSRARKAIEWWEWKTGRKIGVKASQEKQPESNENSKKKEVENQEIDATPLLERNPMVRLRFIESLRKTPRSLPLILKQIIASLDEKDEETLAKTMQRLEWVYEVYPRELEESLKKEHTAKMLKFLESKYRDLRVQTIQSLAQWTWIEIPYDYTAVAALELENPDIQIVLSALKVFERATGQNYLPKNRSRDREEILNKAQEAKKWWDSVQNK